MAVPRRRRVKRLISDTRPEGKVKVPRSLSLRLQRDGEAMLKHAEDLYALIADLDTAVRDSVANGLAHIVEAAYDTLGIAQGLGTDEWTLFVSRSTEDWFRQKGFANWFCEGAAVLFRCDPPRRCVEMFEVFKKSPKAKRKKVA